MAAVRVRRSARVEPLVAMRSFPTARAIFSASSSDMAPEAPEAPAPPSPRSGFGEVSP